MPALFFAHGGQLGHGPVSLLVRITYFDIQDALVSYKRITISFEGATWVKLRRLQEAGEIKSFQDAVEQGIELLLDKMGDKSKS